MVIPNDNFFVHIVYSIAMEQNNNKKEINIFTDWAAM